YAVTFDGGTLKGTNVDEMTAELFNSTPGGTIKVSTSVQGGFAQAVGVTLTFDSTQWWVPQPVYFVVNAAAEQVPTNADFQNSVSVSCTTLPCPAGVLPTIKGTVKSSVSRDTNPNIVGDEYSVLIATDNVFQNDLPSAGLPEGLHGEQLKITGSDAEAEGQILHVVGSYSETLTIGSGVTSFTISFGG